LSFDPVHGISKDSLLLENLMNTNNMLVLEAGEGLCFSPKTLPTPLRKSKGRSKNLEGDPAPQAFLFGEVNCPHASLTNLSKDPIPCDLRQLGSIMGCKDFIHHLRDSLDLLDLLLIQLLENLRSEIPALKSGLQEFVESLIEILRGIRLVHSPSLGVTPGNWLRAARRAFL
jgi:hypothetical protein